MGHPPDIVHMNQRWIKLAHKSTETPDRRSALKHGERLSPGRKTQCMSGNGDRVELLSERARSRTDHVRLPCVAIKCFQQGDQIAFRSANRLNPMHVQNSRAHYLASG